MVHQNSTIPISTLNVIHYSLQLKGRKEGRERERRRKRKEEKERKKAPTIYCLHDMHFRDGE